MKVLCITLVVLALAFATESDDITLIHKIDTTALGKTLFDTIYMQLQAGDPLETLVSTLHDLEDRYIAEQKEDDANHYDFQMTCDADIAAYDKDLAESNTERIRLEAKLEGDLYPRRDIMTGVVNAKTAETKDLQKQIDELDAFRAEEAAEFDQIVKEHEEATAIITEVRRMFEDEFTHDEFLQKKNTKKPLKQFSLIQKTLQEGIRRVHKFAHKKHYGSLFKIFLSITNRAQQLADGGHLSRIIDLCNELLHQIEESLDLERFAEDKRIEAYKKSRNFLTIALNVARTELANAQTELSSILDQIQQTETSLENTNLRIDNLSEAREDRWNQCEEAALDYANARSARGADRQVVSDCIGLVNQSLRTLKEQLALRMQAGETI